MNALRSLFSRTNNLKKWYIAAMVGVVMETVFEVLIPLLMARIIDVGIPSRDPAIFWRTGIWMLACAVISLLFGLLYAKCAARASALTARQLRSREYEAILNFSFGNIDHFETSGLITRMTSDISVIQNAISTGLRPLARGPIMLVMGILMTLILNWRMALVFFAACPVLACILIWIIRKVAPSYPKIQAGVDELNAAVQENLIAIRLVRAFVRGDFEEKRFDEINNNLKTITQNTFHYALLNQPAFQASMYGVIAILMFLGCGMILQNQMQVGELTGILSYVLQIMNSFMMMSNVFLLMTRSMASVLRINQVFDELPELESAKEPLQPMNNSIEFDHVDFKYSKDAKKNVLEEITLNIPANSRIGILGATGSAKSSLVQLIPRLYDVSSGVIRIGGVDVRDMDLEKLHDEVGVVLQQNALFSGTVLENLKWGNENATDSQIEQACREAAVDELLERLPGGLNAELGQGGSNVSGGQKQRICIARALLKNPKILIFDDSTSALDSRTDERVWQALDVKKDMTQIVIAQRIASLKHCDQIIILEDGKIVDQGSPDDLMKSSRIYREIWASQNGGTLA